MAVGCSKQEPRERNQAAAEEVVWQSEHFVVHTRSDDTSWCQGVLGTLEHHFQVLRQTLGFDWPLGAQVEYHKFTDQIALRKAGVCSAVNDACFFADKGVYTTNPLELHELVHAYLARLGDSHPVLEEGIAEALSCGGAPQSAPPDVPLAEAFSVDAWSSADRPKRRALYRAAAWFVADVFRRVGKQRFLELYATLRREHGLAEAETIFARVSGESIAAAWQRALSSSDPDGACLRAWECAATDATNSLERGWFQRCEQDDRGLTLTLQTPAWVLQEAPGRGALLGSCGDQPTPHAARINRALGGNDQELFWLALAPGKYFVQKRDAATRLRLDSRPLQTGLAADCSKLQPLPSSFVLGFEVAFAPGQLGSSPRWLALRDVDPKRGRRYTVQCSAGVSVEGCTGCDEDTCQPLCAGQEPPLRASSSSDAAELLLRVGSATASDGSFVVQRDHRRTGAGR